MSWPVTSNYTMKKQVIMSPACDRAPLGRLPEGCFRVTLTSHHTCVNVPNVTYSFGRRKFT